MNGRDLDEYFPRSAYRTAVRSPLELLGSAGRYEVVAKIEGGGPTGQAEALRHGIARALAEESQEGRGELKAAGMLTRDPRAVERKKSGLKKARKRPQFLKRYGPKSEGRFKGEPFRVWKGSFPPRGGGLKRGEELIRKTITFGTDGVRGIANKGLLPEDALSLGLAASGTFGGRIAIGRDTRLSGEMLFRALAAGVASGGADVIDLGVLPTPGVAALAPRLGATAAAVVSASHNPYPDNGIKFFSAEGRKLAPEKEE